MFQYLVRKYANDSGIILISCASTAPSLAIKNDILIRPIHTSPRFSLGLGALFAAVANSYIVSSTQPFLGVMTLADIVTGIGITTIFLTLVESTLSLHIYDHKGERALSRLFDRASLAVLFLGYTAINIAIPWAASL